MTRGAGDTRKDKVKLAIARRLVTYLDWLVYEE